MTASGTSRTENSTNAYFFVLIPADKTKREKLTEELAFRKLLNEKALTLDDYVRLFEANSRTVRRYASEGDNIPPKRRQIFCTNAGIDYEDFLRGVWTPLKTLEDAEATEAPEPTPQSRETSLTLSVTGFCLTILTAAPLSFAIWRAIAEGRGIDSISIISLIIAIAMFVCGQASFRMGKRYK